MERYKRLLFIALSLLLLHFSAIVAPVASASPTNPVDGSGSHSTKEKKGKGTSVRRSSRTKSVQNTSASGKAPVRGKASAQPKTSAEAKRLQAATQKEIRLTEEQIRENERSVKAGLNELGKLETAIAASRKIITATTGQIASLSGQISSLEKGISGNERELKRLRDEYLKAVKKMRVARKNNSDIAFIFASENFNQALRRMRYLRQFSEWKDRQSAAIAGKTEELKKQKGELAVARNRQDEALRKQKSQESTLLQQHSRQDAIVAELRKNGDALKTHLSKKQAEANQLRNQISALIAEEERKAAEERARKEREERLAREREERLAREREEQRRREEEARKEALLAANDKQAAEGKEVDGTSEKGDAHDDKGDTDSKKGKVSKKEKDTKKDKDKKKKDDRKRGDEPKKDDGRQFADARKRRPRSQSGGQTSGSKTVASASKGGKSVGGNFGSMKGSLPKPASGAFKVTSRFGRQSLPDLPDVVYDNPGIDAEVSAGASALAVYAGKVSGVYMLPGYNTVVIVNHGNYYTVYGNIATPAVKVGDEVMAGQGLGALAADADDRSRSSIHFEVWRSREKLNPLEWIR